MNTTQSRFNEARQPLEEVLDAVPADRWSAPSPCEGWTAGDVVGHIIGTQRDFFTERGLDAGTAAVTAADPAASWRTHSDRIADLIGQDAVVTTGFEGFFGPTTVGDTFETFYIWDMFVHRWDIATAAGIDANLTDGELDVIESGAEAFGDGLYMEGICKPGVETDLDADRLTKVLAKLGRRT